MSIPRLGDLAYAFKIDKGTAVWFPCSLPFLAAGLLAARGAGRKVAFTLFFAATVHGALYMLVEYNRDTTDSGYGVRYLLPMIVPMAAATGAVFTILLHRTRAAAGVAFAGTAGAVAAALLLLLPRFSDALEACSQLAREIAKEGLHDSVVLIHGGDFPQQAWDLTQNLPSEREPDVMIVTDWGPGAADDLACARARWASRTWYTARQGWTREDGWQGVALTPMP
jgi:hypothetical protein